MLKLLTGYTHSHMLGWDSVSEMIQGGGKKQTIQINKNKKPHPPKLKETNKKAITHTRVWEIFFPLEYCKQKIRPQTNSLYQVEDITEYLLWTNFVGIVIF